MNYEAAKLGQMDLPIFNGPSEGNFMIGLGFIAPLFLGNEIYETDVRGYPLKLWVIFYMFLFALYSFITR